MGLYFLGCSVKWYIVTLIIKYEEVSLEQILGYLVAVIIGLIIGSIKNFINGFIFKKGEILTEKKYKKEVSCDDEKRKSEYTKKNSFYENKQKNYTDFFNLLDILGIKCCSESLETTKNSLLKIINTKNTDEINNYITEFASKNINSLLEGNRSIIILLQATSSIKLY